MSKALGNLFGSKATPVQTSQSTSGFAALPEFGQAAFRDAVTRAQTVSQDPSIFAPTAFNADQLASMELARQGYQNVTPEAFNQQVGMFSDPFNEQVVQSTLGDIERTGRGLLSDIGAGATSAGAFGGTRQAVAEAETIRNIMQEAGRTAGTLRSGNFQSAADRAIQNIGLQNQLKQQQMSDLESIGALQQAQATQVKQSPLEAIQFLLAAAQGLPSSSSSTGSTMRENSGLLSRISQPVGNFIGGYNLWKNS